MITYNCDICQEEIKDLQEHGKMMYQELGYDFSNKAKKAERVLNKTEYLFCVDCAKKMVEHAKSLMPKDGE